MSKAVWICAVCGSVFDNNRPAVQEEGATWAGYCGAVRERHFPGSDDLCGGKLVKSLQEGEK